MDFTKNIFRNIFLSALIPLITSYSNPGTNAQLYSAQNILSTHSLSSENDCPENRQIKFKAGKKEWGTFAEWSAFTCLDNKNNKKAPELVDSEWYNSQPLHLQDLKGKVVILDFFATWCTPCKSAMPYLQRLWEENKNQGLVVIGIHNSAKSTEEIKEFIRQYKLTFPVMKDRGETEEIYRVKAYPSSFIVSKEGNIRGDPNGETRLESLLNEK